MGLVSLKCPECGGSLQLESGMSQAFCMYCGSSILVQQELQKIRIDNSHHINNYLKLADNAIKNNQYRVAEDYASKVLEEDAWDIRGWVLKCEVLSYFSKYGQNRLDELISSIDESLLLQDKYEYSAMMERFQNIFQRGYSDLLDYSINQIARRKDNILSIKTDIEHVIYIKSQLENFERRYNVTMDNQMSAFLQTVIDHTVHANSTYINNALDMPYHTETGIMDFGIKVEVQFLLLYAIITSIYNKIDSISIQAMHLIVDLCNQLIKFYKVTYKRHFVVENAKTAFINAAFSKRNPVNRLIYGEGKMIEDHPIFTHIKEGYNMENWFRTPIPLDIYLKKITAFRDKIQSNVQKYPNISIDPSISISENSIDELLKRKVEKF